MNIEEKRKEIEGKVITVANRKRLSLLPTNNNLDHVSWAAMTMLIEKARNNMLSEREELHIQRMAAHVGLEPEQFVADMENRIEDGLIMATGTLIGVSTAAKMIQAADTEEGLDAAFLYYNQYMNFF